MSQEKIIPIVVVTFNGCDFTKECIKSIRTYTIVPYRLIVVDNNSTDGTVEYLRSLTDIDLLQNDKNLGFAGGFNKGIQHALNTYDFDYLVMLNNDLLVTPSYIQRLLEIMKKDSKCGLVGPVCNYAGGRQNIGVPATMKTFEDVGEFANQRYLDYKEDYLRTGIVTGLFYLIKREVLENVGLFDERFFPGQWEDNDFCLRMQLKGYRLYVHNGVFMYHYGGKSIRQFDQGNIFFTNKKRFINKWKEEWQKTEPKLVGMLRVKNGEPYIERCLETVSRMCDEIVVLDDHSTDNTYEICKKFPKVVKLEKSTSDTFDEGRDRNLIFQWAKERNPDWIYCIDADEIPEEFLIDNIKKLLRPSNPQALGYVLRICHFWNSEKKVRLDGLWGPFYQCRLFRVLPRQSIREGSGSGLHIGSHPSIPAENLVYTHYRIKHYGNMDKEKRKEKYNWYTKNDTEGNVAAILGGHAKFYFNLYYGGKSLEKESIDEPQQTVSI